MHLPRPTAARAVGGRSVAVAFALLGILLLAAAPARAQDIADFGTLTEFPIGGVGCVYDTSGCPNTVVAGPDGNLWFVEFWGSRVGRMAPDGTDVQTWPTPTASAKPEQIALGPDGSLWFSEYGAGNIGRVDPSTGVVHEFAVPTPNSGPVGIAAGPDGNVWFVEQDAGNVGRIDLSSLDTGADPATVDIDEFPIPGGNSFPFGIVAGPDRAMWFTEQKANAIGRIPVDDPSAIETFPIRPSASEQLHAHGITLGADGNLWFIENVGQHVGRIDPITREVVEWPLPNRETEEYGAYWIATGHDGNVWFTGYANDTIGRVTPDGTIDVRTVPDAGSEPYGIAPGLDCDIWFTQFVSNEIARLETGCAPPPDPPAPPDPPVPPAPPTPTPTPDPTPAPTPKPKPTPDDPTASRLSIAKSRLAPGAKTWIAFRMSAAARVTVEIERQTVGRRKGRRCVRTTKRTRRLPACRRFVSLQRSGARVEAGRNRLPLRAAVRRGGRLRKLAPGRYRVALRVVGADKRAKPRRVVLRVVRR